MVVSGKPKVRSVSPTSVYGRLSSPRLTATDAQSMPLESVMMNATVSEKLTESPQRMVISGGVISASGKREYHQHI